jgi:hypothetical protein
MDNEILDAYSNEKTSEKIYIYIALGLSFLNIFFFSKNEYLFLCEYIKNDPLNELVSYSGFGIFNILLIIGSVIFIQFFIPLFFSFFFKELLKFRLLIFIIIGVVLLIFSTNKYLIYTIYYDF